jgi:hypothetical protein
MPKGRMIGMQVSWKGDEFNGGIVFIQDHLFEKGKA